MDKATLVSGPERWLPLPSTDGRRLSEALDRAGFSYQAAFWLFQSDFDDWRLHIATTFLDEEGPRQTYQRIQTILRNEQPALDVPLSDVTAVSPNSPVVRALKTAYHVTPDEPPVYIRHTTVAGTYIEEALIYRI